MRVEAVVTLLTPRMEELNFDKMINFTFSVYKMKTAKFTKKFITIKTIRFICN